MRLPNGFGTVYKLSGKRRRPYIARKTVGHNEKGRQIFLTIGYFENRNDAIQALAQYSAAPYDVEAGRQKFSDIFDLWFEDFQKKPDTGTSSVKNYRWAYNACENLHEMKMHEIRPHHMQSSLSGIESYARQKKMLLLFHRLYEFCIERDYLQRDYSTSVHTTVKSTKQSEKVPFTAEETEAIWKALPKNEAYGVILVLLYSGLRVSELLNLRSEDVHLDEQWFFIRASKTDAGVRNVPIADKVLPIWKNYLAKGKEYAFTTMTGNRFIYDTFLRRYWQPLLKELNIEHTIHETRHTFITNLTMKNVNHTLIKKIVGHVSGMDLTERIYTHASPEFIKEMIKAVNLL